MGFVAMLAGAWIYTLAMAFEEKGKRGNTKVAWQLLSIFSFLILVIGVAAFILLRDISQILSYGSLIVGVMVILYVVIMLWRFPSASGFQQSLNDGSIAQVDGVEEGYYEEDESTVGANAGRAGIASSIRRNQRIGPDGYVVADRTNFSTTVTTPDGRMLDVGAFADDAAQRAQAQLIAARAAEQAARSGLHHDYLEALEKLRQNPDDSRLRAWVDTLERELGVNNASNQQPTVEETGPSLIPEDRPQQRPRTPRRLIRG